MNTADEVSVDLDEVRPNRRPQLEAGVPFTEVIQRDGEAHRLVMADGLTHQCRVKPRGLLSQLDDDLMRVQPMAMQEVTCQSPRMRTVQQHLRRHVQEQALTQALLGPLLKRQFTTEAVQLGEAPMLASRLEHRHR